MFDGLRIIQCEITMRRILVAQGKLIYERPTAEGGCSACPGIRPGQVRFLDLRTWATPIQNVGTDTLEYDVMAWPANTGVLQGAFIPFVTEPLEANDRVFNVLTASVLGSIAEHVLTSSGLSGTNARLTAGPVARPQSRPTSSPQLRLPPTIIWTSGPLCTLTLAVDLDPMIAAKNLVDARFVPCVVPACTLSGGV
jgi:hypothetical protein